MGFFNKLFSSAGSGLVDSIGKTLDNLITSDEEREKAKLAMQELVKKHEENLEAELTKRHKYDMQSDSWLSKNIRPGVLVYSLLAITIFALADGNIGQFTIHESYIDLMGNLLMSASLFYFGARSVDKYTNSKVIGKIKQQKRKNDQEDIPDLERKYAKKVNVSDKD